MTKPSVETPVAPVFKMPEIPVMPTINGTTYWASTTYTLAANSTNILNLTGTANINGTGNALDNKIIGNTANNKLVGGAGNDVLDGWLGNDYLDGGPGNDFLQGGVGIDTMVGGTGNDTYVIDNQADVIIEKAGEGIDWVIAGTTYRLPANVENLIMLYTGAYVAYGNDLDNILVGNSGNNYFEGGAGNDIIFGGAGNDGILGGTGADTMIGGEGDDWYSVDNPGDVVIEYANEGTDIVGASVSYTLPANVENLNLDGNADINGTGNELANVIRGNSGNNVINGMAGNDTIEGLGGNDTLTGGAGDDKFVFIPWSGKDVITDFGANGDHDSLDFSGYYKFGYKATIKDVGNDVVLTFATGDQVTLLGVHASELIATATGYTI